MSQEILPCICGPHSEWVPSLMTLMTSLVVVLTCKTEDRWITPGLVSTLPFWLVESEGQWTTRRLTRLSVEYLPLPSRPWRRCRVNRTRPTLSIALVHRIRGDPIGTNSGHFILQGYPFSRRPFVHYWAARGRGLVMLASVAPGDLAARGPVFSRVRISCCICWMALIQLKFLPSSTGSASPAHYDWSSDYPEFTSSEDSPYELDLPTPSRWLNEENAMPTSRIQRDTSISRQVPWRSSLPSNEATHPGE